MNENKLQQKNLLPISDRIKNKNISPINSSKYINTESKQFKNLNLTPLEQKVDTIALNRLLMKSVTMKDDKSDSYDKKYKINSNISKTLKRLCRPKHFQLKDKISLDENALSDNDNDNLNYFNSHNNLDLNKKYKILEKEKILQIEEKLKEKYDKYQKFLSEKELLQRQKIENEKIKSEKRNIKIKMYKLIQKKGQLCQSFEKKNDSFNLRFVNYLNSNHYINSKKIYNSHFRFSKNDLNKAHNPYNHYLKTFDLSENSINLNDIFNSFNNKDKKIIEKEPEYFFKDNKFLEILNDLKNKPLVKTLREEEEIEKMKKNKISNREIDEYIAKNDIINQKVLEYSHKNKSHSIHKDSSIKNNDETDNNMSYLFNKDTLQTIKNELDMRLKPRKKDIREIFNKELTNCERTLNKKNLVKLIKNKNKNLNFVFNKRITFLTRIKSLDNNKKKLDKEELFKTRRRKINDIDGEDDNYINRMKSKISNVYSSLEKNDLIY